MKPKFLSLILTLTAIGSSACTLNVGTTPNAANTVNAPAANAVNSTPNTAKPATENKTETAKKPEAETPKKTAAEDSSSEEQIQFAKGETDTTLERTIAPNADKMFLFNAKKGQTLWFKVTESTNQLGVDFNKRSVELDEEVRETLNASGDWAIYVSNPTDKPLKYTLWIGIE